MQPDPELVDEQLERIFAVPPFLTGRRLRSLLRYLVDAGRSGGAERIKGYTIGIDVFGRDPSFDPATDAIVRVQVGRLRAALDSYYALAGKDETIRISIPKGSYRVDYTEVVGPTESSDEQSSPADLQPAVVRQESDRTFLSGAITVGVLPFSAQGGGDGQKVFADNLVESLTTRLARIGSVSVAPLTSMFQFRGPQNLQQVAAALGVRYVVDGSLQTSGEQIRVNIHLVDAATNSQVWSGTYDREISDKFTLLDELATRIVMELRCRLYVAACVVLNRHADEPQSAWQLFLRSTFTPGGGVNSLQKEQQRVALAREALVIEGSNGRARSVLGEKLAYLANVDPQSDTPEQRAEADEHARISLELEPGDSDVIFNVSICHWHAGRIDQSINATRRTLELEPTHLLANFLVSVLPFTGSPVPPKILNGLVAFEAELTRDNPARWIVLTWISLLHLNNADYDAAADFGMRTHQIYKTPDTRYRLGAALVQLGRADEARALILEARNEWPTYDLRHYADVVVPRRCGSSATAQRLQRDYRSLAEVCD
jgi:TolB-like protein